MTPILPLAAALALALAAAASAGDAPPAPHPHEVFLGARIPRTMTLLETSDEVRHNPVRILCYGQSIMAQGYVSRAIEKLAKERYPQARVEVRNCAIGGYTAPTLVRTAAQDVAPFYPDLVVFHVYDGHETGELERIVQDIRRTTTAEILMWTHHVDAFGADGTERDGIRDQGSDFRRMLAQKYGAELVELREEWKAWLAANPQVNRKDLLCDAIHLNDRGGRLMAELVMRHFRFNTLFPSFWADQVRNYEVRRPLEEPSDPLQLTGPWKRWGDAAGIDKGPGSLKLAFHGNRVVAELWPVGGRKGTATVLVDGKAPSAWQQAYAVTRTIGNPLNSSRPSINRVLPGPSPVAEDWTISLREMSEDGRKFRFSVTGSVTGADGDGDQDTAVFTSKSGRITFEPREVTFKDMAAVMKKPSPPQFDITCRMVLLGSDTFTAPEKAEKGEVPQAVLIQGIPNGQHTLEIRTAGDGPFAIRQLVVHRPPLD